MSCGELQMRGEREMNDTMPSGRWTYWKVGLGWVGLG